MMPIAVGGPAVDALVKVRTLKVTMNNTLTIFFFKPTLPPARTSLLGASPTMMVCWAFMSLFRYLIRGCRPFSLHTGPSELS
jgi:hypothetical protein